MRRFLLTLAVFFLLTAQADAAWVWPVSGEVITPYRNGTDPYANGQHRGIDIAAPVGTPVVAAAAGDVRFAGTAGSSGLTVSIRTGDGYDTSYLHLSSLAVRAGGQVSAGERIGAVGTTGVRSATAPHLHFGVRDAGTRHDYHDPLAFLPPPPAAAPEPPPPAPVAAPQPAPPAALPVAAPRPHADPRRRPLASPHRRPLASPRRRPLASPRRLPLASPHRRPLAAPHGLPHAGPHRAPPLAARLTPSLRATPRLGAVAAPRGAPHGAGTPRSAPHAPRTPTSASHALAVTRHAPDAPAGEGSARVRPGATEAASHGDSPGGSDIGWIAACVALLLAGGLLGVTGGDRRRPGWAFSLAKWQGKTPNPARSRRG